MNEKIKNAKNGMQLMKMINQLHTVLFYRKYFLDIFYKCLRHMCKRARLVPDQDVGGRYIRIRDDFRADALICHQGGGSGENRNSHALPCQFTGIQGVCNPAADGRLFINLVEPAIDFVYA